MKAVARTRLRLLLRDASAGCAFMAMAVSGQVPGWAAACFAVGMGFALANRRPLVGRARISTLGLLLGAVLLYSSVAAGRLDLVVAACTFAGLLTLHRMLAEPTPSTEHQVHLTSLLMVAGGAALSGELLFALCLVAFTLLACLSQGLAVVDRAAGEGAPVPTGPLFRLLALSTAVSLAGGVIFFVVFPRLSWNVAGRRGSLGLGPASSGFSGTVTLGGSGSIKTNPRVVLRATLSPDPGRPSLGEYWVGRRLTHFDGVQWTGSSRVQRTGDPLVVGPRGTGIITQQVELLPAYGSRTLVALDPPVQFSSGSLHLAGRDYHSRLAEVPPGEVRFESDAQGYSYQAWSRRRATSVSEPLGSEEKAQDLELPSSLDPRIVALARNIVGRETEPSQTAARLEAHLRESYAYTLDLPGRVPDPLADFLFHRKAGHCEHFATALAVLLRTQGIPARVVTGFYGGERVGSEYVVRAGDAHAWVEAWMPGRGFVRLDATPEARRGSQSNPALAGLLAAYEWLESKWQSSVMDYSFRDQAELARELAASTSDTHRTQLSFSKLRPGLPWLAVLGALGTGALLIRARRRGVPKSTQREERRLLVVVERLLRQHGLWRVPGSLEDTARDLRSSHHPLSPALDRVTRRYLEARFGGRPLARGERRALARGLALAVRDITQQTRA